MRRVSVSFSVPNDVYSDIVKPAKDSNTLGSLISESLRLYQSSSGVRSIVSKGAMRATSDELDSLLDELNSSIGSLDAGIRGMSDDVDAYGETYHKAYNGEDLHEDTGNSFAEKDAAATPSQSEVAPEGTPLVTRDDFEEFKSEILSAISSLLGAGSVKVNSAKDGPEVEEYLDFGDTEDAKGTKSSREGSSQSQESNPKDTTTAAQEEDPGLPSGELRVLATPTASASKPSAGETTPASAPKTSVGETTSARESLEETSDKVSGADVLRALGEETPSPGIQDGGAEEVDADAMNAFSNLMSSAFSDWE